MLRKILVTVLLAFGLPLAAVSTAGADTFTVTSTADSGLGTLRQAFIDANGTPGADTIVLGEGLTYQLTTTELTSTSGALVIEGNGSTIEQTAAGERVIHKTDSTTLTLNDVTVTGGRSGGFGGGIFGVGQVVLDNSVVTGNQADESGGGIWTELGSVTLTNSTVSDNTAGAGGGGIEAAANVSVTNSTVSGNTAAISAGGIGAALTVTLLFATVVDNGAALAANINTDGFVAFGSVVALPFGGGANCFHDSATTSQGYNFSDDASCGFTDGTDVQNAGDPGLNPLGFEPNDPIGDTPVHLPDGGSPLINQIPASHARCGGTDQRGVDRPQSDGCDIGSVEVRPIVAGPGSYTTDQGVEIVMDLNPLVEDPDSQWPGGDTEIHWTSDIGNAALEGDADMVRYTPAAAFTGTATIDYEVCSALDVLCSDSVLTIEVVGPPTTVAPLPVTPVTTATPIPVSSTPAFTG